MLAEHTRAAKTDVMGRWGVMNGFWFFYILHRVVNECKHCECKKVIKSRKRGCSVVFFKNEYILLYHLQIWHVYTACVSQCSELVTSAVGAHRWWRVGNSDWKSEFYETIFSITLTAFFKSNSLWYYGITCIWTEIDNYFVILFFSTFPVWSRQYCFKDIRNVPQ